jgi:pilus assembly protein CpaB
MRRRLLPVLAFASIIGLLASLAVYRVVAGMVPAAADDRTESVVVASVNMTMAETVTDQHVKLVPWPKGAVPAGAVRTLEGARGRVVRSSIVVGEPLLEAKLAPELSGRGGIMPMLVPEGRRGITIRVDDAVKESGFVLPNSRVDVLVTMARSGGSQDRVAKVILQDVLVLAAGQTVEMRDNKPVQVTTVTLALTPEEGERLALALNQGKLTLATRNLRDGTIVQTRGVTPAALLADTRPAPSRPATAAAPRSPRAAAAPAPPRLPDAHAIAVMRGNQVTEIRFVRDPSEQWRESPK